MKTFNLAVLASGNGSNAAKIIRYFNSHPQIGVSMVLTNNPSAFVLERARELGVESFVFDKATFRSREVFSTLLAGRNITHIVLAGFLWLIPEYLIKAFPDRIINIHPALLPSFGGKGMYGARVHEAVKAAGVAETGITIHLVNEHYDEGKILFQGRCTIDASLDAPAIAEKVHALEHQYYPAVIEAWVLSKPLNF